MESSTSEPTKEQEMTSETKKREFKINGKTYTDRDEVFDLVGTIFNNHLKLRQETSTLSPEEQSIIIELIKMVILQIASLIVKGSS
jgi:hypothetical protein